MITSACKPNVNQTSRFRGIFRTSDIRRAPAAAALLISALLPAAAAHAGEPVAAAVGGPVETVSAASLSSASGGDAQFKALFTTWKKLDTVEQGSIAIPSSKPVANVFFSSSYGVRSDPFRGSAAMHAGVDIPGPIGTPIYATADGMIARAERANGYGNLVEINHGKGIETRYGHLSKILVSPNTRVKRGQLIALMGSTGRSTGSHLHYEVRVDGRATNPMPFLESTDYLLALQQRPTGTQMAQLATGQGGPTD